MPHRTRLATPALLLLLVGASACDRDGGDAQDAAADGVEAVAERALERTTPPASVKEEVKTFLKDQSKKGCEMLPPATVARELDVPEGELKQIKIMGCTYSWESADKSQTAEASIISIWVKQDAERARMWFENATKTQTAEELRAQMEKIKERAKESKELDSADKQQAMDKIGDVATGLIPDGGYTYEDVPGVGDAARVNTNDGALTVLVGNMVFNVRAYKGPPAEPPDRALARPENLKKLIQATKEANARWLVETRDTRVRMGAALAKAIVAEL